MSANIDELIADAQQVAALMEKHSRRFVRIRDCDIDDLRDLVERINPRYPLDSITFESMLQMLLCGRTYDAQEQEILEGLLPTEYRGEWQKTVSCSGNEISLEYAFSHRRSGGWYVLYFDSLSFPITVTLDVFADMDDLSNHCDECPQCLLENDEECCESCECESYCVKSSKIVLKDTDMLPGLTDWIEEHMWDTRGVAK